MDLHINFPSLYQVSYGMMFFSLEPSMTLATVYQHLQAPCSQLVKDAKRATLEKYKEKINETKVSIRIQHMLFYFHQEVGG